MCGVWQRSIGCSADNPSGEQYNNYPWLYETCPDACPTPTCGGTGEPTCAFNPCLNPDQFRPGNSHDDAPHCVGDEPSPTNTWSSDRAQCVAKCSGAECCKWEGDTRPTDPCHCSSEALCTAVGATWTPRSYKCNGNIQTIIAPAASCSTQADQWGRVGQQMMQWGASMCCADYKSKCGPAA